MAKSDTKRVRMLDTVEDTTSDLVRDEATGKKRLAYQTVRLLDRQEYDLPTEQADDLIAQGKAEAVGK